MKLRGDIFKQIRRKRGLSQTALAEGICTQATISLMEKQNRIPKMNILTALCSRLDISANEIIENDDVSMTATFDQIGRLLAERQFEDAQTALQMIKVKNLQNEFDKQRYYYLLGMLQVQNHQFDEAIFNFELVLTQFSTASANIYLAMTTIGMAMAYEKIGSQSRALRLVERAMRLIDEKKLTGGQLQWIVVMNTYLACIWHWGSRSCHSMRRSAVLKSVGRCARCFCLIAIICMPARRSWHWPIRRWANRI